MKIDIQHRCTNFDSYRVARVKSLFNCEDAARFSLNVDLPLENEEWGLGLVVGPSGSGKTSIGSAFFKSQNIHDGFNWPKGKPVIDAIGPKDDFNKVTAALTAVGLGSVPAWLRPYHVLSNGEKFRAELARIICDAPDQIVIDEFSSVVDRQIARIGASAFGKAWRRTGGKAVLLSCHYDIIDWLNPDWILDTKTGEFSLPRGSLRRPEFELDVFETNWRHWPLFEPHHYLKLPHMVAATNYVGCVNGEPVAHLAVSTLAGMKAARACRLVILPEWQGAGVGLKFLEHVMELWLQGRNRYNKPMPTFFHTSHPGLCAALRRRSRWRQTKCRLYGERSSKTGLKRPNGIKGGFGGHWRAVQAFKYEGVPV